MKIFIFIVVIVVIAAVLFVLSRCNRRTAKPYGDPEHADINPNVADKADIEENKPAEAAAKPKRTAKKRNQ